MRRGIEFPIWWCNAEQNTYQEAGLEVPRDEMYTVTLCFYEIAFIRPSGDEFNETIIASHGNEFICPLPYATVREMIDNCRTFELN